MARVSLIALGILILVGLVLSFLPSAAKPPLGEVTLENVDLVLYPAADPNAKWTFKAGVVKYNPESRSSVATELSEGKRLVKGKLDLILKSDSITIDSNDNMSTQIAKIFIPSSCSLLRLGQAGSAQVLINQDTGFQAPYVDMDSATFSFVGTNFSSHFDLSASNGDIEAKGADKAMKTCAVVKAAF